MYSGNQEVRPAPTREGRARLEEVEFVRGYAEPGYGGDDAVIALGDWNEITRWDRKTSRSVTVDRLPARVAKLLEKAGVAIEWQDEWTTCHACGRAVRTQADSYSWTRSYVETDDGAECEDCVLKDPEAYLATLEGEATKACTFRGFDPEDHGYVRLAERFEHGLHGGQDADPAKIDAALRKRGVERFLFKIDDVGQFDLRFSVYLHESEELPTDLDRDSPEVRCDLDPATACARAMREGAVQADALPPGPGVTVVTCRPNGTATARKVSPEDFVAGKALEREG